MKSFHQYHLLQTQLCQYPSGWRTILWLFEQRQDDCLANHSLRNVEGESNEFTRIVHWFLHNTCCWCAAQYGTVVVINIICVDRFENFYFEIAIRPNAWFFVPMRIHFVHGNNFKIKDEYTARTDSLYMISYHMMLLFDGTNRRRDARALAGKRVKTNDKNNIPYQPVFISY